MKKQYIICVDDEKIVLDSLAALLHRGFGDKYLYEFAESAAEAIEIINDILAQGNEVVMIISDQVMPGMTGDQFLVHMHKSHPQLIKVLLTGQASVEAAINSVNNAGLFSYLRKPWQENEIMTTVSRGIEHYSMHKKMLRQLSSFKKFVPESFLKLLKLENIEDVSGKESIELAAAVLFADIRGFTSLSEAMGHKKTFEYLNEYHALMSDIVTQNEGVVEKFIGDGILAIFQDSGIKSTKAAIEIINAMPHFNSLHEIEIKVGIGISVGPIVLGTVGSKDRIDITVIGDKVNEASRIESLTKFYGCTILVEDSVKDKLPAEYKVRYIDTVRVRGQRKSIKLFEILETFDKKEKELLLSYQDKFMEAINLYKTRRFFEAEKLFMECTKINPQDHIVKLYLQRTTVIQNSIIDDKWDGITDFNL